MRSACIAILVGLLACSSGSLPDLPAGDCSYYETEVVYPVGAEPPQVDAGPPLHAEGTPVCLPPFVVAATDGGVPCAAMVSLPEPTDESRCTGLGFELPDPGTLDDFLTSHPSASGHTVCVVPQLMGADLNATGTCASATKAGWCYVTGPAAEGCRATIALSEGTIIGGANYAFECSAGC